MPRVPRRDTTVYTVQVLFNVVEGGLRPDIPQHCPQRYRAMVEKCWAQDPDDRWAGVTMQLSFICSCPLLPTLFEAIDIVHRCHPALALHNTK